MIFSEILQPAEQLARFDNGRYTPNYPHAAKHFDSGRMGANIAAIQEVMSAMRETYPGKSGIIGADRMLGGVIPYLARQRSKVATNVVALPTSSSVTDKIHPAHIAQHVIEGYSQRPRVPILDPHMQEPANIAVVGNLDIIPYLVLQDLITRGVDPREIGFITFDQHFDASAVVRNGVHEGNWISAAVRDGIGAVAVLGNAGDQAKQLRDETFTELFSGEEMPIAGEEARLLKIKDPGLIDHLRTLRDHPNVLLDHMMMSNNARNTDPAQMRRAIKKAMAHFERHHVKHVISFVDLDVLAMVDEPITATNYNVHDWVVRLGMAPLLLPHAFLARRTTSARGKPTYTETHVREAEDEVSRFMEGAMQIQGTLYHPPRAAGPGGMTVGQAVQAIDMTRRFAAEYDLQYGVPVGDKRVVLGGVTEVQGKDVQGKSLRAAGEIYNAMINPRI